MLFFLFQCLFQFLYHNPQSLDPGIFLVYRLQDMPRRVGGAGFGKHLIHSLLIPIPLVAVAPVLLCDLPLLRRGILPLSETFQLGILINLYPELDDDSAPVMKFFLKFINLMVGAFPPLCRKNLLES